MLTEVSTPTPRDLANRSLVSWCELLIEARVYKCITETTEEILGMVRQKAGIELRPLFQKVNTPHSVLTAILNAHP